jgi:hypothetical protein
VGVRHSARTSGRADAAGETGDDDYHGRRRTRRPIDDMTSFAPGQSWRGSSIATMLTTRLYILNQDVLPRGMTATSRLTSCATTAAAIAVSAPGHRCRPAVCRKRQPWRAYLQILNPCGGCSKAIAPGRGRPQSGAHLTSPHRPRRGLSLRKWTGRDSASGARGWRRHPRIFPLPLIPFARAVCAGDEHPSPSGGICLVAGSGAGTKRSW